MHLLAFSLGVVLALLNELASRVTTVESCFWGLVFQHLQIVLDDVVGLTRSRACWLVFKEHLIALFCTQSLLCALLHRLLISLWKRCLATDFRCFLPIDLDVLCLQNWILIEIKCRLVFLVTSRSLALSFSFSLYIRCARAYNFRDLRRLLLVLASSFTFALVRVLRRLFANLMRSETFLCDCCSVCKVAHIIVGLTNLDWKA